MVNPQNIVVLKDIFFQEKPDDTKRKKFYSKIRNMPYTEIQNKIQNKAISEATLEQKIDISQKQKILFMDWSELKQLLALDLLNKKIIFYKIKNILRGVLDIKEVKSDLGKLPFIPLKLHFKD